MEASLEGKDASLWVETTKQTNYPKLEGDDTVYDVLVIGGGITGVMAAYYAQLRGLKTALIEKNRLIEWTTGNTTAKLTSQHYLLYHYLIERHGAGVAQSYADANERGIRKVEELSESLGIDCEFSRRDAYVFTTDNAKLHDIHAEVEAALELGLPASFESTIDLPFNAVGAIKFSNQAQFHPRKFLLGIVDKYVALGGVVYEHTKATDIIPADITTVTTKDGGDLRAKYVIEANGEPFWPKDLLKDRMWSKMSYALAVTLNDPAAYPQGLYITTDDPLRTIRTASFNGRPILIFGGESHEFDPNDDNPDIHYQRLIDDVHRRFDVDQICFRWLAGDYMPYDRMPYFGALPDTPSVYAVTGYRAWGLAWAMSAAEVIVDHITGQPDEWAKPFSFDRLKEPPREGDKVYGI